MNKQEAIAALEQGKTIRHSGFSSDEWMKLDGSNLIVFENGIQCTREEFWQFRTESWWDDGWSVIDFGFDDTLQEIILDYDEWHDNRLLTAGDDCVTRWNLYVNHLFYTGSLTVDQKTAYKI